MVVEAWLIPVVVTAGVCLLLVIGVGVAVACIMANRKRASSGQVTTSSTTSGGAEMMESARDSNYGVIGDAAYTPIPIVNTDPVYDKLQLSSAEPDYRVGNFDTPTSFET
jgi:hypothetical protein